MKVNIRQDKANFGNSSKKYMHYKNIKAKLKKKKKRGLRGQPYQQNRLKLNRCVMELTSSLD